MLLVCRGKRTDNNNYQESERLKEKQSLKIYYLSEEQIKNKTRAKQLIL